MTRTSAPVLERDAALVATILTVPPTPLSMLAAVKVTSFSVENMLTPVAPSMVTFPPDELQSKLPPATKDASPHE